MHHRTRRRIVPHVDKVKTNKMCDLCIAAENAPPPAPPVDPSAAEKVQSTLRDLEALGGVPATPSSATFGPSSASTTTTTTTTTFSSTTGGGGQGGGPPSALTALAMATWGVEEAPPPRKGPAKGRGGKAGPGPGPGPRKQPRGPDGLISMEDLAGHQERVVRGNSVFKELTVTFSSDEESEGDD